MILEQDEIDFFGLINRQNIELRIEYIIKIIIYNETGTVLIMIYTNNNEFYENFDLFNSLLKLFICFNHYIQQL